MTKAAFTPRISTEAYCLDDLDLKELRRLPHRNMRVLSINGGELMRRKMVEIGQPMWANGLLTGARPLFADTTTGSLYDARTGLCLSSDTLKIHPGDLSPQPARDHHDRAH